jgi:TorA maturation chaperone TorD
MSAPSAIERALRRGGMYRLCALALAEPDAERLATVEGLADGAATTAAPGVRGALRALRDATRATEAAQSAAEYARLFDGAVTCPPCEGAYGPPRMAGKGAELADVAGFYAAFGLERAAGQPHVEDHIATELEFMSALAVKEAWALAEGHGEHAEISRDVAALFLAEHLGRWAAAFADGLRTLTGLTYYRAVADVLDAWVREEAAALDVRLDPLGVAPPDASTAEPFVCPMEPAEPD